MRILFFKSAQAEDDGKKIPLPEKLLLIFRARMKDAETEELREEAVEELAKLGVKRACRG